MTYPNVSCPRCDKHPIEITEIEQAEPAFVSACTCYPHPPRCPLCHQDLEDGRCINLRGVCPVFDQLVPVPDVDPLWEAVAVP